MPREQAYLMLAELCDVHLLAEHAPRRYSCHDLLRAYAAERAHAIESDAERRAAVRRVLDYYLHTARAASGLLCPYETGITWPRPQPGVVLEEIGCPKQAEEWFENEQHALFAMTRQAVEEGYAPHAWELPWVAGWYFQDKVYRQRLAAAQESALALAVRLGDLAGQATARQHLGWLRFLLGDVISAGDYLDEAAKLAGKLGDGRLCALAGLSRAYVLQAQDRILEAKVQARSALRLHPAGDRKGEVRALHAIGWHLVQLGDYQHALSFTRQVLMLYREAVS
jgi:tetratricopeptide (TPR) repeat protein